MPDKLPLEFHPEALAELERAKQWYERKRHGLGESFFQEITAAIIEYRKPQYLAGVSTRNEALPRASFPIRSALQPTLEQFPHRGCDASETTTGLLAIAITISRRKQKEPLIGSCSKLLHHKREKGIIYLIEPTILLR